MTWIPGQDEAVSERDRAVRTVVQVLTDWGSRVAVADRERLATYIVDALPARVGEAEHPSE